MCRVFAFPRIHGLQEAVAERHVGAARLHEAGAVFRPGGPWEVCATRFGSFRLVEPAKLCCIQRAFGRTPARAGPFTVGRSRGRCR
eukprot:4222722-Lingulodinium_polyedra.AAC.1